MSIKEVKEGYIGHSPLINGHPLEAALSSSIFPSPAGWSCPVIIVILGCLRNLARGGTWRNIVAAATAGNLVSFYKGPALYQIPFPHPQHRSDLHRPSPAIHPKSPLLSALIPILSPSKPSTRPPHQHPFALCLNSGPQASHLTNVSCLDSRHPLNVCPSFPLPSFPSFPVPGYPSLSCYAHHHHHHQLRRANSCPRIKLFLKLQNPA